MKDVLTLGSRIVLGGYLAAHGAQKLFGSFGGPGLDQAAQGFEHMGLTPGKPMATLAGASELAGGTLVAAGAAHPLGPAAIAGTMAVATLVHTPQGPFGANGGYEQAATNLALAGLLAAAGSGRYSIGKPLPRRIAGVVLAGSAALTAASIAKIVAKRRAAAAAPAVTADALDAPADTSADPAATAAAG